MNDENKSVPTEFELDDSSDIVLEPRTEEEAAERKNNLKEDFIWFKPGINAMSRVQCTCERFLEADESTDAGFGRLAKKALRHAQRTGHTLNPRGNWTHGRRMG